MISVYGLLIGVAVVISLFVAEFAFKRIENTSENFTLCENNFWQVVYTSFAFGIVGSRVWHVVTDWQLYAQQPFRALLINQGGVSILGALCGGFFGIFLYHVLLKKPFSQLIFWLDLAVLAVPFGQIIGRLGNFINQELYGLPSSLPWAIFIDSTHRIAGFEQFETYHPLFLYEMLLLLPLVGLLWYLFLKKPRYVGTGYFFLLYLAWYGFGRFGLEFLRIDKTMLSLGEVSLGKNQLLLYVAGWSSVVSMAWLFMRKKNVALTRVFKVILLAGVVFVAVTVLLFLSDQNIKRRFLTHMQTSMQNLMAQSTQQQDQKSGVGNFLSTLPDRTIQKIEFNSGSNVLDSSEVAHKAVLLNVEIVNTPASTTLGLSGRTEIGSDGMLFVFRQQEPRYFWMKDMLFDLDMVWIRNGEIVGITQNVPKVAKSTPIQNLERYHSPEPVDMVLELPAGYAQKYSLFKGDTLLLK